MNSMEEIREKRLVQFINTVLQPFFGSVWWILDSAWKQTFPAFIPRRRNDRTEPRHPGVGLRMEPISHLFDPIPLLLGSSGKQGPVVVRGLTSSQGRDYETSFGVFGRPATFGARDFIQVKDPNTRGVASRNAYKFWLNEEEQDELKSFLIAAGFPGLVEEEEDQ